MFNVIRKNGSQIKASFKTEDEAKQFLVDMGMQRNFFKVEEVKELVSKKKISVSSVSDDVFEDAVQITRANVKYFYKKEGLIRVVSPNGKVLHTGKTTNMGKVFSNYVNCARYNQSYDFNLEGGDKLFFKEMSLES
jgi:hypothetical protein